MSHIGSEEAREILADIESQLESEFEKKRSKAYNRNTKGHDYEIALSKFYQDYLGGAFDFETRRGIWDAQLEAKSLFSPEENEFDVVAIYKNAVPKLVHDIRHIPYDAVAFVTEISQTLDLSKLRKDLGKFMKLSKLQVSHERFRFRRYADPKAQGQINPVPSISRPVRVLLYYEAEASEKKVFNILTKNGDYWDMFLILKKKILLINTTLPIVSKWFKSDMPILEKSFPLLKAMIFICYSVEGRFVDSLRLFWNLIANAG